MYECYLISCIFVTLKIPDYCEYDDFIEKLNTALKKHNLSMVNCMSAPFNGYLETLIGTRFKAPTKLETIVESRSDIVNNLESFLKESICENMTPLDKDVDDLLMLDAFTYADG